MFCCYSDLAYVTVTEELKDYSDAIQHCVDLGARLMEVRTQEKFNDAVELRNEIGVSFWLAAKEIDTDGNWQWNSDSEAVDLDTGFWFPGRPNTNLVRIDCLHMPFAGFYDVPCGGMRPFVCEFI